MTEVNSFCIVVTHCTSGLLLSRHWCLTHSQIM